MARRLPLSNEQFLYLAIFGLALLVRLGSLGASPLTELEAGQALNAHRFATGLPFSFGDQPAYVLLTGLTFFLFGSSDVLARLWPVLIGSAFVLLPYAMRARLGRVAALILAFGLAIAPELVAVSRLASGTMLGLAFPLFAVYAWSKDKPVAAGMLAGLALLSGPFLYVGLAGLAVTWLLVSIFDRSGQVAAWLSTEYKSLCAASKSRYALIALGLTLGLGATFFLRAPQGFSALGASLASFLQTLVRASGIPISYLLLALAGTALPALLFGWLAALRAWREADGLALALTLWAGAALLVALVLPGHQVIYLLWATLPLWALAARELARHLNPPRGERSAILGVTALVVGLLAFLYLHLAGAARLTPFSELFIQHLWLAGGVVALGTIALILIAFGWSRRVAVTGLVWGLAICSVLGLVSLNGRLSAPASNVANNLWSPGPAGGQAALLMDTLRDLSGWRGTGESALAVMVEDQSQALQWLLRDWPDLRVAPASDPAAGPAFIITSSLEDPPNQFSAYRGQDFAWAVEPDWAWPPNLIAWLLFREAPTRHQELALWARADLFPGGLAEEATGEDLEDEGPFGTE